MSSKWSLLQMKKSCRLQEKMVMEAARNPVYTQVHDAAIQGAEAVQQAADVSQSLCGFPLISAATAYLQPGNF